MQRRETGVKTGIHIRGRQDPDRFRQNAVTAGNPGLFATINLRVKVNYLSGGMDTGVGATSAEYGDGMIGDTPEGLFDFLLDRSQRGG